MGQGQRRRAIYICVAAACCVLVRGDRDVKAIEAVLEKSIAAARLNNPDSGFSFCLDTKVLCNQHKVSEALRITCADSCVDALCAA
jgi:hypothetical protein